MWAPIPGQPDSKQEFLVTRGVFDKLWAMISARYLLLVATTTLFIGGCGGGYVSSPYQPHVPTAEEAEWDRYHAAEEEGSADEALAGYDEMCRRRPPYPRACYDLSRLLFELERFAEAREASTSFIVEYPEHALAPTAAKRLGRHYAEAGRIAEGVAALTDLARTVDGTDAEDSVRYEIARLHRAAGDLAAEAAALQPIVAMDRWDSQLWNDAIWRLIEVRSEQGDRAAEERLLEELLDTRESSYLIGSYTTGYHDDAMLRLGRLRLDDGRLDEAYDIFIELSRWDTSRERDDGLLWAARARLAQGRERDACKLLGRLLEKMPDASCHRDAKRLFATSGCGEL